MTSPKGTKSIIGGIGLTVSIIIGTVIGLEGGFVDHPEDTGGATKYGITHEVARANGYIGPMELLSKDLANAIYEKQYVYQPKFHLIVSESNAAGGKVIDAGVNTGVTRAATWFQRSLNVLNRDGKDYAPIKEDGLIGPATLSAFASLQEVRGRVKACELVLKLMDIQQGSHYMSLTKHRSFMVGWVDNRIQNIPLGDCNE